MKVVLLSTNMARGGAETQVAQVAIGLRRRGWDVDVISMLPPSAFQAELASEGVRLHAPGIARIPLLVRELRPQILHCHMFHANVLGRLLHLAMPFTGVISTLHSVAESNRRTGAIRGRNLAYLLTNPLATVTVAVSQAVADRHHDAWAVRHMKVIPNGVDTIVFRPNLVRGYRMRREMGLSDFVWLAVGRLMWKKNYPALLRAFHSIGRGSLLIAGSGPDEAELRALVGPNVWFLGERDDIAALMNAADAFVLSSVVEGLPLVLLEAAASGLPCVATDAGGVRETGIGIVAEPGELSDSMRRVMDMDADERRAMGEAGCRRVREHYSLDAVVSQWESLYRQWI